MYVNAAGELLKKAENLEIGGTYYIKGKHNEFDPVTALEFLEDQKVRVRHYDQEITVSKNALFVVDQDVDLTNPPPNDQLVKPPITPIVHVFYYIEQPGSDPVLVFVMVPFGAGGDKTKAKVVNGRVHTYVGNFEVPKSKLYAHPQAYTDAPNNNMVIEDLPVPMQLDGGRKRRKSVRRRKSKRTRRHSRR